MWMPWDIWSTYHDRPRKPFHGNAKSQTTVKPAKLPSNHCQIIDGPNDLVSWERQWGGSSRRFERRQSCQSDTYSMFHLWWGRQKEGKRSPSDLRPKTLSGKTETRLGCVINTDDGDTDVCNTAKASEGQWLTWRWVIGLWTSQETASKREVNFAQCAM